MNKEEQWFSLFEEWEGSQMSQEKFCKSKGIKKSTFGYWRKKHIKSQIPDQGTPLAGSFIALETPIGQMEIIYPNGVRVQVPTGSTAQALSALIRLY